VAPRATAARGAARGDRSARDDRHAVPRAAGAARLVYAVPPGIRRIGNLIVISKPEGRSPDPRLRRTTSQLAGRPGWTGHGGAGEKARSWPGPPRQRGRICLWRFAIGADSPGIPFPCHIFRTFRFLGSSFWHGGFAWTDRGGRDRHRARSADEPPHRRENSLTPQAGNFLHLPRTCDDG